MWERASLFDSLETPFGGSFDALDEHAFWLHGLQAGVDEVGIGPLAGAVVAAAVILDPARPIESLTDSKQLNETKRVELDAEIRQKALTWALGRAEVEEVDRYNVLRASHLAMQRAVSGLSIEPQAVLVDGNKVPKVGLPAVAIVKGDQRVPQISAASIIAKVARDAEMTRLDGEYPGYGFARHKGYPTKAHFKALAELGPSAVHRKSFAPVEALLVKQRDGDEQVRTQSELGL